MCLIEDITVPEPFQGLTISSVASGLLERIRLHGQEGAIEVYEHRDGSNYHLRDGMQRLLCYKHLGHEMVRVNIVYPTGPEVHQMISLSFKGMMCGFPGMGIAKTLKFLDSIRLDPSIQDLDLWEMLGVPREETDASDTSRPTV